jgi:hypothetical protein
MFFDPCSPDSASDEFHYPQTREEVLATRDRLEEGRPERVEEERIKALVPGIELVDCDLDDGEQVQSFFDKIFGPRSQETIERQELMAIYFRWLSEGNRNHAEGRSGKNTAIDYFLHEHGVKGPIEIKRLIREAYDRGRAHGR